MIRLSIKSMILATVLGISAQAAVAAQTVQVVWPFSPSSSNAVMVRNLIEAANKQQNKYNFVFNNKPGAGGTVGAMTVADEPGLAVLISTSSFYTRPLLFKDSHNVDQFSLINDFCGNQPLGIFSKRYKNMADMSRAGKEITIGVNPGAITSLVNRTINKNNKINFVEIPYKGTPEATSDMMGGHVESAVEFIGPMALARMTQDVNVVGITGQRNIGKFVTFQSQGIKGLENVVHGHYIFVKKSTPDAVKQELNAIFNTAFVDSVRQVCESDQGQLTAVPYSQTDALNNRLRENWRQLTQGMSRE